jgi:hypothetical protein
MVRPLSLLFKSLLRRKEENDELQQRMNCFETDNFLLSVASQQNKIKYFGHKYIRTYNFENRFLLNKLRLILKRGIYYFQLNTTHMCEIK